MSNSPEQISAFEKQIENSIDFEIAQLQKIDEQKSEVLSFLKSSIFNSIKKNREDNPSTPEKEEKYSADLRLTEDELKQIFEEVKKENEQLFVENELENFREFWLFIGLNSNEISFAHSLQEVILFGRDVELVLPLGINNQITENFIATIRQIEKRKDLEPFITVNTKLISRGGMRLEFTVQKEGKEVRYSATPERVLRVDQEPPVEQIKNFIKTELNLKRLERQLRDSLQWDKTLSNEQKIMMLYKAWDQKGEVFKIPEKYQTIIDQIEALNKQSQSLYEKCSVRMLFDETSGKVVREKSYPLYTTNFNYEYLAQDGSTEAKISYSSNKKDMITEYFPHSEQAQKRTIFHKNGNIRRVIEYQTDRKSLSESSYRQDGTLETKIEGRNQDVYDKSGTNVLYRRLWPEGRERIKNVMVGKNGESFATLDFMRQQTPEMSDDQYLDYLAKNLDTPQKLHFFFELFMRYVYDDPKKAGSDHFIANFDGTDYWQLPEETIHRVKDGKMLGDCDDYAFLAKDILRRQGKAAYVASVGRGGLSAHALCIWCEKNPYGNWDAYSMDNFGFDKNGNRYGMPVDPEKEKGYATLEKALNSLMPKYNEKEIGISQSSNYRITNGKIELNNILEKGKPLFITDVPVELLSNQPVLDLLLLAQSLTENGDYEKAISEYEKLLQIDPVHSDLYHKWLASTLKKTSEKSGNVEAERILLDFINKYPDRPEYYATLGELWWELQDEAKAQEQFLLAIKHGCTDAFPYICMGYIYKEQGNTSKQIEVLELAIRSCPDISYDEHAYLAYAYLNSGNIEKSIQTWEKIIRKNPNEPSPKIELAKTYHETDPKKAREMYEGYIAENPNIPEYYEAFGRFYREMLQRECDKNPTRYDPDHKYSVNGKIDLLRIDAEFFKKNPFLRQILVKQIAQYEKAILYGSENLNIYLKLIKLYAYQEKMGDMFRLSIQAIEKNPDTIWLQSKIVDIYEREGKKAEVFSIYQEIIRRNPDNSENYISLGKLYEYEDEAKAFQNFLLAIEKGSTSQEPYMKVANHYKQKGQIEEQIKTLKLALEKVPSHALNFVVSLDLAEAYLQTGNQEKATQIYEEVSRKKNRFVE